jgi:hypothetical protein
MEIKAPFTVTNLGPIVEAIIQTQGTDCVALQFMGTQTRWIANESEIGVGESIAFDWHEVDKPTKKYKVEVEFKEKSIFQSFNGWDLAKWVGKYCPNAQSVSYCPIDGLRIWTWSYDDVTISAANVVQPKEQGILFPLPLTRDEMDALVSKALGVFEMPYFYTMLDVVKLDKWIINTPDGISFNDYVKQKYGEDVLYYIDQLSQPNF